MRTVRILVCGEPMRGDDGVAAAIAGALGPSSTARRSIRNVGQLMPDDLRTDAGPVIVLDAVAGPAPGHLIDLDLAEVGDAGGFLPSSCHALPLPMVVGIAARLQARPPEGRFIGVAGGEWGIGAGLTPPVLAAVGAAAERVEAWIETLSSSPEVAPCA